MAFHVGRYISLMDAIRGVSLRIRNGSGLLKHSSFSRRKNTSSLATIIAPPCNTGWAKEPAKTGGFYRMWFLL